MSEDKIEWAIPPHAALGGGNGGDEGEVREDGSESPAKTPTARPGRLSEPAHTELSLADDSALIHFKSVEGRPVRAIEGDLPVDEWAKREYWQNVAARYKALYVEAVDRDGTKVSSSVRARASKVTVHHCVCSSRNVAYRLKTKVWMCMDCQREVEGDTPPADLLRRAEEGQKKFWIPEAHFLVTPSKKAVDNDGDESADFRDRFLTRTNVGVIYFKRFVEEEHSAENLIFWLEADKYREIAERLRAQANKITRTYLDAGAPYPVSNVSMPEKDEIIAVVGRGIPDVFADARRAVLKLMKHDTYKRFAQSSLYQDYLKAIGTAAGATTSGSKRGGSRSRDNSGSGSKRG